MIKISEITSEHLLTSVGVAGVVVNAIMVLVTLQRKSAIADINPIRAQIKQVAFHRAMRVEVCFLLAQIGRMIHSAYIVNVSSTLPGFIVLERAFATIILIYLSVIDYRDRRRMVAAFLLIKENEEGVTKDPSNGHKSIT